MTTDERLRAILKRLERFYGALPTPPLDAFGLYVWRVVAFQGTPQRRDAAMAALRHIPALTPDAMSRVPRGRLEAAVTLAGSLRDERRRALIAGATAFRRNRELVRVLKGPLPEARAALAQLPHLTDADGEWLLLFGGDQPILPADPRAVRVLARLGHGESLTPPQDLCLSVARDLAYDLNMLRHAILYLSHHGSITCTEDNPHCVVCPLLTNCPYGQSRTAKPRRPPRIGESPG
jgi:endonuclease III